MKKRDVLGLLEDMPEKLDSEELMYRISVLQQLEEGEADITAGNVITHEELVRQSDEWMNEWRK